jgi:hypothetical protein
MYSIALRMMPPIAKKKQGSSVARNIFAPRHVKNLRAAEEIFSLSVALTAFTTFNTGGGSGSVHAPASAAYPAAPPGTAKADSPYHE